MSNSFLYVSGGTDNLGPVFDDDLQLEIDPIEWALGCAISKIFELTKSSSIMTRLLIS